MEDRIEDLLEILRHITPGELLAEPARNSTSNLYLGLLGFFVILFIASIVVNNRATQLARGNRVHLRLLDLYSAWFAWLSGAGIIIVGLRYASVQLLSKRIWVVLDLLAILAVVGYFIWYRIRRYPGEIEEYLEEERKRRFLPTSRRTTPSGRRRRR